MEKPKITSFCGLDCDACDYKEKFNCKGCVASGGSPFHGECSVEEGLEKLESFL